MATTAVMTIEDEIEETEDYYDGFCNTCGCEWFAMEQQNICPECNGDDCETILNESEDGPNELGEVIIHGSEYKK